MRSLSWKPPRPQAPSTPHRTSYPRRAQSSRTTSNPRSTRRGEFSTKINRGRHSSAILATSFHRPERLPDLMPSPFPADEISWQGNPPVTMSTSPCHGLASKVWMSSQMGNSSRQPSRCRWRRTSRRYGSISTAAIVDQPSSRLARSPPPLPANSASSFIVLTVPL